MTKASATPNPTRDEIQELVAFLPRLYADDFVPAKEWHGGEMAPGVIQMPYPEYDEQVSRFFRLAAEECWRCYDYGDEGNRLANDPDLISNASLEQLKAVLTFCVRGERFCDGHWEAVIKDGIVRRILERLQVMLDQNELTEGD